MISEGVVGGLGVLDRESVEGLYRFRSRGLSSGYCWWRRGNGAFMLMQRVFNVASIAGSKCSIADASYTIRQ